MQTLDVVDVVDSGENLIGADVAFTRARFTDPNPAAGANDVHFKAAESHLLRLPLVASF